MALAKVTAQKYDYGAYARPTPVRINPAMYSGFALLGQGLTQGVEAIVLEKEKIAQEQKIKKVEGIKSTAEYAAKVKIIQRKTGGQNEEFWRNLVEEHGNNQKEFAKGLVGDKLQTYYDTNARLNSILQQAIEFKQYGMKITESDANPNDISISSIPKLLRREALTNDLWAFKTDEYGDLDIEFSIFDMKAAANIGIGSFTLESFSVEDFITGKYTDISDDLKYNRTLDATYAKVLTSASGKFKSGYAKYGQMEYLDQGNNIYKWRPYKNSDGELNLNSIVSVVFNDSESLEYEYISQIISGEGKKIYEDELAGGPDSYDSSNEEHKKKVRDWLNDRVDKDLKDVVVQKTVDRGIGEPTTKQIEQINLNIARNTLAGIITGKRKGNLENLKMASGEKILKETHNNDGTVTLRYATGAVRYSALVKGEKGYEEGVTKMVPRQPSATATYSFSNEDHLDKIMMILTGHPNIKSAVRTGIYGESDLARSMASLVNKPGLWDSNFNTPTPKGWKELQESGLLSKITKERLIHKDDPSKEFSVEGDEPIMEEYLDYRDLTGLEKKHIAEYLERFTKK